MLRNALFPRLGERVQHQALNGRSIVGEDIVGTVELLLDGQAWVRWPVDAVFPGFPGEPDRYHSGQVADPYLRRHAIGALEPYVEPPPLERTPEAIQTWLDS